MNSARAAGSIAPVPWTARTGNATASHTVNSDVGANTASHSKGWPFTFHPSW